MKTPKNRKRAGGRGTNLLRHDSPVCELVHLLNHREVRLFRLISTLKLKEVLQRRQARKKEKCKQHSRFLLLNRRSDDVVHLRSHFRPTVHQEEGPLVCKFAKPFRQQFTFSLKPMCTRQNEERIYKQILRMPK